MEVTSNDLSYPTDWHNHWLLLKLPVWCWLSLVNAEYGGFAKISICAIISVTSSYVSIFLVRSLSPFSRHYCIKCQALQEVIAAEVWSFHLLYFPFVFEAAYGLSQSSFIDVACTGLKWICFEFKTIDIFFRRFFFLFLSSSHKYVGGEVLTLYGLADFIRMLSAS